jgi:glycosyltransferase involved in cell wall biosynthesis
MTTGKRTVDHRRSLVIIPAHNEQTHLPEVVASIRECLPGIHILVVDDGSRDKTRQAAASAGAMVLSLPFNMGYGVALQTGYKFALRRGYRFAAQMDADGQHEPRDLSLLLDAVRSDETDLALGSRFLDRKNYRAPLARRAGMLLFRLLASLLVRQHITDPTSGCQALNRKTIRFYASDIFPVDYPDADVLLMVHRAGLRIKELPVRMYAADDNASMHSGLQPVYYIFKMFLSIAVTLLRKHSLPAAPRGKSGSPEPGRQQEEMRS